MKIYIILIYFISIISIGYNYNYSIFKSNYSVKKLNIPQTLILNQLGYKNYYFIPILKYSLHHRNIILIYNTQNVTLNHIFPKINILNIKTKKKSVIVFNDSQYIQYKYSIFFECELCIFNKIYACIPISVYAFRYSLEKNNNNTNNLNYVQKSNEKNEIIQQLFYDVGKKVSNEIMNVFLKN